jgi:hypothetical protein
MMHPFTTQELVGQRRAALHAEASHARLAGQLRPRARDDPERPGLPSPPGPWSARSARWSPASPSDQPSTGLGRP